MSDSVIQVENLGKKYVLGQQQQGNSQYVALRDVVADGVKSFSRRLRHPLKPKIRPQQDEFWALKDVSFDVKQGEVVGIIGRNGAGKSTLLKILSRITEPTTGRVRLRGRVASLLEVGTGFHPELTGRENIFLNGAILGMSRAEISRKFDEIVEFAEVERFLDTPVKRYSSGMYVRLAFAVAAHLEPEILVVDEVLAVGDAAFQKKCLGKMEKVGKEGRTVFFVSHNMATIKTLCGVGILLQDGNLVLKDEVDRIVDEYTSLGLSFSQDSSIEFSQPSHAPLWMESATLLCNEEPGTQLTTGDSLALSISYRSISNIQDPKIGLVIYSAAGHALINANNHYQINVESLTESKSSGIVICDLGKVPLMEGKYFISLWLGDSIQNYHHAEHALGFDVSSCDIWGTAKTPPKISPLWWPTQFFVR